jgi:hypothetical protein
MEPAPNVPIICLNLAPATECAMPAIEVKEVTYPIHDKSVCPVCNKPKRPIRVEPDARYINLSVVTSVCDCGEDSGRFIAHKE